jgi:hypothetical protein
LSIFKSHKYIYAQIVDDDKGHTLLACNSTSSKAKTPVEKAKFPAQKDFVLRAGPVAEVVGVLGNFAVYGDGGQGNVAGCWFN